MVSALFVETGGVYCNLEGVDPWDQARDARQYAGPHPVVAHPPCKRWGRYWSGGPNPKHPRQKLGDDGGCFAAALYAVRTWGGVIEHPEASHAWSWFGLPRAPRLGWGWSNEIDRYGGRACAVTQGRYGHKGRKLTWLYAVLPVFPALDWRDCENMQRMDAGFQSSEQRRQARQKGIKPIGMMSRADRLNTPLPFRDLLLSMVRQ
ncbi:MAG: hypothetical protein CMI60_07365 [Parvibaculum sp.]|nr:hypothetical protein [Parvibaculum sp.]